MQILRQSMIDYEWSKYYGQLHIFSNIVGLFGGWTSILLRPGNSQIERRL
jgi:hypothetical protein